MRKACLCFVLACTWSMTALASMPDALGGQPRPWAVQSAEASVSTLQDREKWRMAQHDPNARPPQRPTPTGFQPTREDPNARRMSSQEREELRRQVREANRQLDEQRQRGQKR